MILDKNILPLIERATNALEEISNSKTKNKLVITNANGYLWDAENFHLIPINNINAVNLSLLKVT